SGVPPPPRTRPQVLRREVERVAADTAREGRECFGAARADKRPILKNRLSGCSLEQGFIISVIMLPREPAPRYPRRTCFKLPTKNSEEAFISLIILLILLLKVICLWHEA
ncbi:hypothetical protein, partial [Methanocalculus sp.]|uniref:hypothetical protein n=1 Tax=Methanocalculus sp. TaxID=2004547 RepID=UPI0025F5EF83